ncbi:putative membrane protein YphA (DoxX/SURF4 family) [Silvibacterium bohemicum]|uniref:Putative membrane protein YphA (DoxX/SURF4 family) n=1 Tax=Silvibacterium bohemicum TaxID=1577686 RepID=A0A841JU82_9BACT|nr:DoxX family membrane protein [Silvibacterium bohemicum]MBB6143309.1 putative membrane protein YphA (DoxX/SURF4 family) [Silvibacterium bohemicum]
MKIAALIARILLGLLFVVFGLNGFLHFIPGSNMLPPGLAGQFAGAMAESHYLLAVSAVEIAGGALLLSGFFVPLGLVLLGPVLVNILFFHLFLLPVGFQAGVVAVILWFVIFARYRGNFAGIFAR